MALVLILVLPVVAAACDWIPRPHFDVVSGDPWRDDDPGDGSCRAEFTGVCTLQAAIDEANASGRETDLDVADGTYELDEGVRGRVRINWGDPGVVRINDLSIGVGGQLLIDGLTTWLAPPVLVEGVLLARHSSLATLDRTSLRIGSTGIVALEHSVLVTGFGDSVIVNQGTLHLRNVSMASTAASFMSLRGPVLVNEGAGSTTMQSSVITAFREGDPGPPTVPACAGNQPVSLGHNATYDLSCGLTASGDQQGAVIALGGSVVNLVFALTPAVGSPLVDAVPAGVNSCGADVVDDLRGDPRPVDGDGDTIAACDIGAVEIPAP